MENDTCQITGGRDTSINAGSLIFVSLSWVILAGNSLNHEGLLKYINDCVKHRQTKMIHNKTLSINVPAKFASIFEKSQAVSGKSR